VDKILFPSLSLLSGSFALSDELEHIKQSIKTIVLTQKTSVIGEPDFGTNISKYLDKPVNEENILDIMTDIIPAIMKYEPRISVKRIQPVIDKTKIYIKIEFSYNNANYEVEV